MRIACGCCDDGCGAVVAKVRLGACAAVIIGACDAGKWKAGAACGAGGDAAMGRVLKGSITAAVEVVVVALGKRKANESVTLLLWPDVDCMYECG